MNTNQVRFGAAKMLALLLVALGGCVVGTASAAGNPCAKNPCAKPANPCAARSGIDPKLITRPAGYKPAAGDAKLGEKLWNDAKLSTNGMSCNTCHANHRAFQASFAKPYPHLVAMAKDQAGVRAVHLDEMIQACMLMPMAAQPLPWDSKELAGLVAYTQNVQTTFRPGAKAPANPCSAKPANPCAAKPANPCATK